MFDSEDDASIMSLTEVLENADPQELVDGICQLAGLEAAVRRRLLEFIVVFDRNELWRDDGGSCMASLLGHRLGLAFGTAAEWVEIAHALSRLPAITAAYDAGKLSWDRLRAAVAIATPETDDDIADFAQRVSVAELESAAR